MPPAQQAGLAGPGAPAPPREGTARKGGKGGFGLVFLGALFLFYGIMFSSSFVARIGAALDKGSSDPRIPLPRSLYRQVQRAEHAIRELRLDDSSDTPVVRRTKEASRGQVIADLTTSFEIRLKPMGHSDAECRERASEWAGAFVKQGVAAFRETREAGTVLLLSYVLAGVVTALATLAVFREKRVPEVLVRVGLRNPEASIGRSLLAGLIAGSAAAAFGAVYLLALKHVPALRSLFGEDAAATRPAMWLIALAVAAAPLFEEFLFRGLLYQGLRRSFRPWVAVATSATIFAIVHPPVSALPVFVLGVATALAFDRTRLLLAPMVAHAVYNAAVLGLQAR
ncbi:MAG: type II CAAX endopeptidase family protein [Planctomycetota bacterium]